MNKGTVKWFNNQKGYGFVTTEEGTDIFVHHTGINKDGFRSLIDGQKVVFDIIDGEKGRQAINVTEISE